ncbi:hypothetical protein F442_06540 [Phytophthora nicotianae P10297]|uniref:Uncharacterized protein n=1 Tax=Phytophthora nicotianae P10297 TaxID=1317064 RepID=W2ZJ73_PHYNI|nr:hypothetical protein F442_06540 [Phytophthora nicotianae P10297]
MTRNRLKVRRTTHKSRKKKTVVQVFSRCIQRTVEEDGVLSHLGGIKIWFFFNMDQMAVYIGMIGRTANDVVVAHTVDVVQDKNV